MDEQQPRFDLGRMIDTIDVDADSFFIRATSFAY